VRQHVERQHAEQAAERRNREEGAAPIAVVSKHPADQRTAERRSGPDTGQEAEYARPKHFWKKRANQNIRNSCQKPAAETLHEAAGDHL
jgi:hypothetical protein